MANKSVMVFVQDSHGDIEWENYYNTLEEAMEDIAVLMKPSMYGTPDYRVVTQYIDYVPYTAREPKPVDIKVLAVLGLADDYGYDEYDL